MERFFLCLVFILFVPQSALAVSDSILGNKTYNILDINSSGYLVTEVGDNHRFYGLATYLNNTSYFLLHAGKINKISIDDHLILDAADWLAIVGRFNVLLIQSKNLSIQLGHSGLLIKNPNLLDSNQSTSKIIDKAELSSLGSEFDQLRYAHLWSPLAGLSKLIERILVCIHTNIITSWVGTIIFFSITLKIMLLPIGIMTTRIQRSKSQIDSKLLPRLNKIKATYDGEEAHNLIIAAHKELGVSPFYALYPILGSFIQVPILIAVFNALAEMPQLAGQHLLWIGDLAYPDSVAVLNFSIPLLGDKISILPVIMTLVTIYSTIIFGDQHAPREIVKVQKRNLYLMAAVFLVLFYPFPAAMLLYWVLANILQTIQQQIIKI